MLLVVGVVAAGVVSPGGRAGAEVPQGPVSWVSTGDSYSSGEGVENNEGACAQSQRAYGPEAADLARQAGWDITAEAFTACTGHLVEDLFNRRPGSDNGSLWEWGHLEQGAPDRVDVLTFSFGGNDIGFVDLLYDCLPVPDSWVDAVTGSALTGLPAEVTGCDTPEAEVDARIDALVDPPRRDCVGGRQNDRRDDRDPDPFLCDLLIDQREDPNLRGSLVDFYVHLAEEHLTDRGRIVVVGYPNLFAPVGEWPGWVKLACQGIGRGDTERLNRLSANLDDALIRAVRAANDRLGRDRIAFLPRSILYRDGSHELCGSGDDWLNGIAVNRGDGTFRKETSFHPNLAGHQATASALFTMLNDLTFDTGAIEADGAGIAGVGLEAPAGPIIDDLTQGLGPPDEDSGWREIDCLPGEPARERVVRWDALSVTITDDPGRWPEPVLSAWLVDARDGTPPARLTVDPPVGVGDTWNSLADQGATWDDFYRSWELEGLTGILNTSTPDAPSTVTAFGAGATGILGC